MILSTDNLKEIFYIEIIPSIFFLFLGFTCMFLDYYHPKQWKPFTKNKIEPINKQIETLPVIFKNVFINIILSLIINTIFPFIRISANTYTYRSIIFRLLFSGLFYSFWSYFAHRLLHHSKFYWIHKKHHEFKHPFGLEVSYMSFIENIITVYMVHLILFSLFTTNENILLGCLCHLSGITSHCGHDIVIFNRSLNKNKGHDLHHQYFNCNYGFITNYLDKYMNTYRDYD
jgi:sterol desaturase/sphingolipid hydroxylase (fatty acid hydroxylase superfamily)